MSVNPIIRATKFTRLYQDYKTKKFVTEAVGAEYNPNVTSSIGPTGASIRGDVKVWDGKSWVNNIDTDPFIPEFQSGMIIIDPELKLLKAISDERNLLPAAGLPIDPNDDLYVIKDNDGNLKSAIAVSYKNMGQKVTVKYLDVDEDDDNFDKALPRLFPNFAQLGENIDIERYEINPIVLVSD